ncbi:MAG: hypothetical protein CME62_13480 [Halobacteriovoraceae bacterium]|nr:hypothetical protein [Halobacteriovoraceae bacterium]|tara:strand:+ start:1783 stop:2277 length:495 start_codon:yes stop_codon:yes gene_type:complete
MDKRVFLIFSILFSFLALGHGDEKHDSKPQPENSKVSENKVHYGHINEAYQKSIQPIFQKACYNCHSQNVDYPWYYPLPGVQSLIDSDIEEAKKHLIFTGSYPFKGHGTPKSDLKAIRAVIEEGSMPPLRYQVMHWESFLSDQEKEKILSWIESATNMLKEEEE